MFQLIMLLFVWLEKSEAIFRDGFPFPGLDLAGAVPAPAPCDLADESCKTPGWHEKENVCLGCRSWEKNNWYLICYDLFM